MSDAIKHECGIAMIHLKKDLAHFKDKYGTSMFAINKMYLMMEKQQLKLKFILMKLKLKRMKNIIVILN